MNNKSLEGYKQMINQLWESVGKKEMKMSEKEFYAGVIKFVGKYLELRERIDKAIELLEKLKNDNSSYYDETMINNTIRDLLDILKGSDKKC